MKVITDLSQYQKSDPSRLVVALGNFDGLHLGHRQVLKVIQDRASCLGGVAAVFTFREHPQRVLHREQSPSTLTSLTHKLHLLEMAGVQLCFLIEYPTGESKKLETGVGIENDVSELVIVHALGDGAIGGVDDKPGAAEVIGDYTVRNAALSHVVGDVRLAAVDEAGNDIARTVKLGDGDYSELKYGARSLRYRSCARNLSRVTAISL